MGAGGWFILGVICGCQLSALILAAGAVLWHFFPLPSRKERPRFDVIVNPHFVRRA